MLLLLSSSSVGLPGPAGQSSSRERTSPRPHDGREDRECGRGLCGGDWDAPEGEGGAGSGFSLEPWRKDDNANIVSEKRV